MVTLTRVVCRKDGIIIDVREWPDHSHAMQTLAEEMRDQHHVGCVWEVEFVQSNDAWALRFDGRDADWNVFGGAQ